MGAGMNAIAFGTKRAFHGFLRVTRKALASFGLTAARFDMLCAILEGAPPDDFDPPEPPEIPQSELREALGVSAPVVTRMLQSLEAHGLVRRTRCVIDRRTRIVHLTERGLECIREARQSLLRAVQRLVYQAICGNTGRRDPFVRFERMDGFEGLLRAVRSSFGDEATLHYGWGHPDD
jgi:DNA-binding MarR family transcriptional regulator